MKPSLQWFDLERICLSFCFTHKRLLHQVRKRNSIPKYSQTKWLCQLWFSVKSNEFERSELNLTFKTSAGWICLGIFSNSCFDCIVLSIHFPIKVLRANPAIFGNRLIFGISLHKMLWFLNKTCTASAEIMLKFTSFMLNELSDRIRPA